MVETAELLSTPTSSLLGDQESYFATTDGPCKLDSTHVYSITLEFMDKDRNYLLSLKEYILVLVTDTIVLTPVPKNDDGHVHLFEARNASMNNFFRDIATIKFLFAVMKGAKKLLISQMLN